jgi:hypothetical protein
MPPKNIVSDFAIALNFSLLDDHKGWCNLWGQVTKARRCGPGSPSGQFEPAADQKKEHPTGGCLLILFLSEASTGLEGAFPYRC